MKSGLWRVIGAVLVLAVAAIGDAGAGSRFAAPRLAAPVEAAEATLLAAGDIASCSSSGDEATAALLDALAGTIVTLGDNVYDNGTTAEFDDCYEPSWGQHKARTKPSAGNHEYNTPGATGYYGYFGAAAGDPLKGYYSFDLGDWHIIALNSNCAAIGGCDAASAQVEWLRADLVAHPNTCTLAYWHHPRFSSGAHGNTTAMQPIWQALYDYRAEIVLSGHDHTYERFAPQTPTGALDVTYGIREFVVGTGGRSHYTFGAAKPNSEVREGNTYGVLRLSLHAASYDWQFVPEAGKTFTDTGGHACQSGSGFDPDFDGAGDATTDNCPGLANAGQENADRDFLELGAAVAFDDITWPRSDTMGDACDDDDDNDGLSDAAEAAPCASATAPTDPLVRDSDGDRTLDGAECALGSDPSDVASQPAAAPDADNDGLPDALDPDDADIDVDNDALLDGREFRFYNSDLLAPDSDLDGCGDAREVASVNGDRTVSAIDLSQVAQHFGNYDDPGPAHLVGFDVNRDGTINAADLGAIAQRFGACT